MLRPEIYVGSFWFQFLTRHWTDKIDCDKWMETLLPNELTSNILNAKVIVKMKCLSNFDKSPTVMTRSIGQSIYFWNRVACVVSTSNCAEYLPVIVQEEKNITDKAGSDFDKRPEVFPKMHGLSCTHVQMQWLPKSDPMNIKSMTIDDRSDRKINRYVRANTWHMCGKKFKYV